MQKLHVTLQQSYRLKRSKRIKWYTSDRAKSQVTSSDIKLKHYSPNYYVITLILLFKGYIRLNRLLNFIGHCFHVLQKENTGFCLSINKTLLIVI